MRCLAGKLKAAVFTFIPLNACHETVFYKRTGTTFATMHMQLLFVVRLAQIAYLVIVKVKNGRKPDSIDTKAWEIYKKEIGMYI